MRLQLTSANRLALAGAVYAFFGCGSGGHAPELKLGGAATPMDSIAVDVSYGTLSFRGKVDRAESGSEFEYRTHIDVTFHPDQRLNHTLVVDLRECRFVASVPGDDNGPWKMLHQESRPIVVHLTEDGQTAHLPDLTFRLPRAIAAQARRVGLAVLDGHLMWPIPVDLK